MKSLKNRKRNYNKSKSLKGGKPTRRSNRNQTSAVSKVSQNKQIPHKCITTLAKAKNNNTYVQGHSDCCFWTIKIAYEHLTGKQLDNDKWHSLVSMYEYDGITDLRDVLNIVGEEFPEINDINFDFYSAYDNSFTDSNQIIEWLKSGKIVIMKINCMTFSGGDEELQTHNIISQDPNIPRKTSQDNHCSTCIGYQGQNLIFRDSNLNYEFIDDFDIDEDDKAINVKPDRTGKHNIKTIDKDLIDEGARIMNEFSTNGKVTIGGKEYSGTNIAFRVFHISDLLLVN